MGLTKLCSFLNVKKLWAFLNVQHKRGKTKIFQIFQINLDYANPANPERILK